jgi:GNAT superfamily N-acetyltransferase
MGVRAAREEDVERVPIIERAAASLYAPYGLESALLDTVTERRRIERAVRAGELWVATDAQDRAVGYALFSIFGEDLHLEELAVMPPYGRMGHGTALLDALAQIAVSSGAARIALVTLDFVPFGAAFYGKRGYVPMDAVPAYMASLIDASVRDGRVALARSLRG